MATKKDNKDSGTIRGKIVWGYVGIYGIIALITAILMLAVFYIITYGRIRDTAHNELHKRLVALPQDTSEDELYEQLEGSMPGYVARYDLYLSEETPVIYFQNDNNEPAPHSENDLSEPEPQIELPPAGNCH